MRFLDKKTVVLIIAVLTVFLLASLAARGKYRFDVSEQIITVVLAPMEYVVAKVGYSIKHMTTSVSDIISVYQDNQTLKTENEGLRANINQSAEIQAENTRLRALLDYKKTAPQFDYVIATVVARDPSTWSNVIVINRGAKDGLTKDMPVVTPHGLVGNLVEVYASTAKVQLILDPRSAVGSLVQRTDSRVAAIIEGSSARPATPRMVNLARDADVVKGDVIITSGLGGIYPKGLVVGEVSDVVDEAGGLLKYAALKTAVDFDRLEEVMVIVRQPPAPPSPPTTTTTTTTPKGGTQPPVKGAGK
ncbi:MAG: mreC: rod shape-determining protein MreC [Firmicutes bacterium]|nr:mreC: rod shape-determining protein MreC [Bacillota bacterium]